MYFINFADIYFLSPSRVIADNSVVCNENFGKYFMRKIIY